MSADKILSKMRQKQGLVVEKPNGTLVDHHCGHSATIDFSATKPEHFKARMAKERARDCPGCRQSKREAQESAAKVNRVRKARRRPPVPPETGLGCTFQLTYVCQGNWHGKLTTAFGETVDEIHTRTMRLCIEGLNEGYWKWKERKES